MEPNQNCNSNNPAFANEAQSESPSLANQIRSGIASGLSSVKKFISKHLEEEGQTYRTRNPPRLSLQVEPIGRPVVVGRVSRDPLKRANTSVCEIEAQVAKQPKIDSRPTTPEKVKVIRHDWDDPCLPFYSPANASAVKSQPSDTLEQLEEANLPPSQCSFGMAAPPRSPRESTSSSETPMELEEPHESFYA